MPVLNKLYLNAGQMKAGTTFLYKLLMSQPGVFFSPEKEIHFLAQRFGGTRILTDEVRLRKAKSVIVTATNLSRPVARYQHMLRWAADYLDAPEGLDWYGKMFAGIRPNQWAADFSNLTCTIPREGLREIPSLCNQLRVTYCLRDPIERAFSHAKFHLSFADDDPNLERLSDNQLKNFLMSPNIFPQSESLKHLERITSELGRSNVRIIPCEKMWERPDVVLQEMCRFLKIEASGGPVREQPVNVGPPASPSDRVMEIVRQVFRQQSDEMEYIREKFGDLFLLN